MNLTSSGLLNNHHRRDFIKSLEYRPLGFTKKVEMLNRSTILEDIKPRLVVITIV